MNIGTFEFRAGRSRWTLMLLGLTMVALLGLLDYWTGPRLSFGLFYLFPVIFVAWTAGGECGAVIGSVCALAWLLADLKGGTGYSRSSYPYWNSLMRLGVFLTVNFLVAKVKMLTVMLKERVRDRTDALSAETAERKHLEREVMEISGREQQRIGQDLHDGLCNYLASIALKTELVEQQLKEKELPEAASVGRIAAMVKQASTQAHDHACGLNPVQVGSDGLMSALRDLAEHTVESTKVNCRFECKAPVSLPDTFIATHLYRIAQEAVSNAVKHSKASQITIGLSKADESIHLQVRDNGVGLSNRVPMRRGMGLGIMRRRSDLIGASLNISSESGQGVLVTCTLPTESKKDTT